MKYFWCYQKREWNKQVLAKGGTQEKGEGMPNICYCFEYKPDIATLSISFSYTELENPLIYCLFSSLITIPVR